MANLDVQKKRKLSFPWILIILVLIVAAVVFFLKKDSTDTNNVTGSPAITDSIGDSSSRKIP